MSNGKAIIILLTVRLMKKILLYKTSYFQEPHTYSKKKKKEIGLDLANYVAKSDLKMQ